MPQTNIADAHTQVLPLKGRCAVISGGSTGIGRAIAVLLAAGWAGYAARGRDSLVGTTAAVVLFLVVFACALVGAMLWLTNALPAALGFPREDRIAVQMCGTQKSLATGLPMATVLFTGTTVGLIVLPLMIFHQIQLVVCAMLAARLAEAHGIDHATVEVNPPGQIPPEVRPEGRKETDI